MTFTNDELQAMNRSTAGKGFTPKAKADRPAAVEMTSKAQLCKMLGISVSEFETLSKEGSLVIEEEYVPAQVAYWHARFGLIGEADRAAAVEPADLDHEAIAQSEALTVRASGGITANAESQGIKALASKRESIQNAMAAELDRLTDPDIFHAEVMAKAAARIRARDQKRGQVAFELDFFDVSSVKASLPKPYQLPQANQPKQLSSAG